MRTADLARLVLLAAIWGGSFALMRITTPVYGDVGTMWLRIGIAGIALVAYARIRNIDLAIRQHWRAYLFVGLVSSAIPFWLFAFAMKTLPASYGALLNATSPLFGAIFAMLMLGERMGQARILGLLLGFAGVGMVVNLGPLRVTHEVLVASAACIAATTLYGFISVYIKKYVKGAPNMGLSACTLLLAATVVTPIAVPATNWVWPTTGVAIAVLALALLCSGVAYLLYYQLIANVGPTRAIAVTFLIPVFGVLWGTVFLGERLTLGAILGGATVCMGMLLVLRPAAHPLKSSKESSG
jgi:drug/metabolite transporter (DMT)-like permease